MSENFPVTYEGIHGCQITFQHKDDRAVCSCGTQNSYQEISGSSAWVESQIPDPSKSLGELKEAAREAEQVFNRLLPLVSMPGCGKDRRAVESALTKLTAALAALEGT